MKPIDLRPRDLEEVLRILAEHAPDVPRAEVVVVDLHGGQRGGGGVRFREADFREAERLIAFLWDGV